MSHSPENPAAASGPSDVDDVIQGKGLIDKGFLMKLAQHTLSSTEPFQLGVFLKVKTSKIQDLMRASGDAVANTFIILETWIDSRHDVENVTVLFDQLSEACLNIKRAVMVDYVRCEQLQRLKEKLGKETAQWDEKRLKVEEDSDEDSHEDTKEQALRVMSMLKGYGQPELWGHVSQHFVEEGQLDLSELLSKTNLPDLVYLLQSGAASDVTRLDLSYNAVFADEEDGRALGAALTNMSTLRELDLSRCSLTDLSWPHIADGIIRGCRQLETLDLDDNDVFADEEAGRVLGAALANMSTLCKLNLSDCSLTDKSFVLIAYGIILGSRQLKTLNCQDNKLIYDSEKTKTNLLTHLPHLKIRAGSSFGVRKCSDDSDDDSLPTAMVSDDNSLPTAMVSDDNSLPTAMVSDDNSLPTAMVSDDNSLHTAMGREEVP